MARHSPAADALTSNGTGSHRQSVKGRRAVEKVGSNGDLQVHDQASQQTPPPHHHLHVNAGGGPKRSSGSKGSLRYESKYENSSIADPNINSHL